VPSTNENKNILNEKIEVVLNDTSYFIDIYDTALGSRWLTALKDNLLQKKILEKNFCFLGFPASSRNLTFLVRELNRSVEQINSFKFDPPYEKLQFFTEDDFQFSANLPIGKLDDQMGLRLKHDSCNLLHRHFENLQGTAWKLSNFYKQADNETKYAIRQLNNLCHEIESWVLSYRKSVIDPGWIRPSQITTFLNAPRYDLKDKDFELFKQNRYNRELGGVYLHWSQIGKTLLEVYRDENAPELDESICSAITHQRYYSGEFDVEWGKDIQEDDAEWHRETVKGFRKWLESNGYDWEEPKLSLGYIKLGQVDLYRSFGSEKFEHVQEIMSRNLNIKEMKILSDKTISCKYPYTLESNEWKNIQIQYLRKGYESYSLR